MARPSYAYGRYFALWQRVVFWLLLWSVTPLQADQTNKIDLVINGGSPIHVQFSGTLTQSLHRSSPDIDITLIDISDPMATLSTDNNRLIVSVGTEVTDWALSRSGNRPLLATLIPRQSYLALHDQFRNHKHEITHSAIYIDQPLRRQVKLLQQLFPDVTQVGTLLGPTSRTQADSLQTLLTEASMNLSSSYLDQLENPIPDLESVLNRSDVFLALPDPAVFNRQTLTGILLTTYRHRVPVIGFSNAYVEAGALAAVYSSAEQIAQHTAETIDKLLQQPVSQLPPPTYPHYFSVALNKQVARALSIELPKETLLEQRLRQLEQDQTR